MLCCPMRQSSAIPALQKCVRLMQRPVGAVVPGKDLVLGTGPVLLSPSLGPGEIVVKNLYLSLDPAMRGLSVCDLGA
jgi:NADPH-dependent curcumin reductase CurA